MSSKEKLRDILLQYLDFLVECGGSGDIANLPNFDYYAVDYIEFAELNLQKYYTTTNNQEKENELISCLSNLKRALDCQIECFLESWNLRKDFNKKNLGIDKKLSFLSGIGIFSSRTIKRFSNIRNKFEHEFHKPEIQDLEALFDLVSAFVAILQNSMTNHINDFIEFEILNETEIKGHLSVTFNIDEKNITFKIFMHNTQEEKIIADLKKYDEFTYFFRCLYFLNQMNTYGNKEHIKSKIAF